MNQHQKLPISQAELARLKGVTRGAVSRAMRGPLAAARMADRVDRGHPAVRRWLGEVDPSRLVSLEELARLAGVSLDELERERHLWEDAMPVDLDHPATQAFLAKSQPTTARRQR